MVAIKNRTIPRDYINNLVTRVNIIELIGSHITLQKSGHEFKGLCPFHAERTPSFTVIPGKNFFYCFGCGMSGDPLKFIQVFNHLTFVEAVRELASLLGVSFDFNAGQAPSQRVSAENAANRNNLRISRKTPIDIKALEAKKKLNQQAAVQKANSIIGQSRLDIHPYLERKGFPALQQLIYEHKIVIPMRVNSSIIGCQLIDEFGDKKFLYGQTTKLATFIINKNNNSARVTHVVCEGYVTGLTAHLLLQKIALPHVVHVCFSAKNMVAVAKTLPKGLVIADNDVSETGLKAAIETGWPHWISPVQGQDINDFYLSNSLFECVNSIKKVAYSQRNCM